MEYLLLNGLSPSNISNHLAAIRAFFIVNGLNTIPLRHDQIAMYHKSIKLNIPFTPKQTSLIDIQLLTNLIQASKSLPNSEVFVALYSLAFFSFLRLSNLLPHSIKTYDHLRHLARGDVIVSEDNITLLIKWSKTIQNRKDVATIVLPALGNSVLCPHTAVRHLLSVQPGSSNSPVFQIQSNQSYVPLTDSVARKHLKKIAILVQAPKLTFHDFRRSGTTWAYEHGVPIEAIKAHGTWRSDTVYKYIASQFNHSNSVSTTFRQHLHQ